MLSYNSVLELKVVKSLIKLNTFLKSSQLVINHFLSLEIQGKKKVKSKSKEIKKSFEYFFPLLDKLY